MNAELATLLTGETNAEQRIEQVLFGDLFLQCLDDSGTWYRYHHLFRDFLRQRLERDQPERSPNSIRWPPTGSTSRGCSPGCRPCDARQEASFATDVVEEQALRLVEHSRMATLLALVEKLPKKEIGSRSWLQLAIAWAYCLLHFPE